MAPWLIDDFAKLIKIFVDCIEKIVERIIDFDDQLLIIIFLLYQICLSFNYFKIIIYFRKQSAFPMQDLYTLLNSSRNLVSLTERSSTSSNFSLKYSIRLIIAFL